MKSLLIFCVFIICSCSSGSEFKSISDKEKLSLSLKVGATEKAQSILIEKLKKDPDDIKLKFELADVYYQQGRYELQKSILSSMKVSDNKSDFIKINTELMKNSLKLNDYSLVSYYYDSIEKPNQINKLNNQQHGKILSYLAISYCKRNLLDKCIELLDSAVALMPGDTVVLDNLSIAKFMKSNSDKRGDISMLSRAYNESHSDAMLSNLVMALVSQGDEGQAYTLLTRRYSQMDALKVIDELKKIHYVKNI